MHSDARRNLEAHIQGERNRDLDALMAPLSDMPRYVIPGWVLEGGPTAWPTMDPATWKGWLKPKAG